MEDYITNLEDEIKQLKNDIEESKNTIDRYTRSLRFYCSIGPFGPIELMQELESSRPVGAKGLEGPPP